jgi:hypothetical protein
LNAHFGAALVTGGMVVRYVALALSVFAVQILLGFGITQKAFLPFYRQYMPIYF